MKIKSMDKMIAERNKSYDFYSLTSLYLPNPDEVLKSQGKDIATYRDLSYDPHVWACLEARKAGLMTLEWEIDRGKAKSREARKIEYIFSQYNMHELMGSVIEAVMYGYKPFEIIFRKEGNLVIPDLVGLPPEWFNFSNNNELLFRTHKNYDGEYVNQDKFIVCKNRGSYANPYGEGVLSRCYWWVTFKRGGMRFWLKMTEKYGMPFPIGKYPASWEDQKDKIQEFLNDLSMLAQDGAGAISENTSIEYPPVSSAASADLYRQFIAYCDNMIAEAILGQSLTTDAGEVGSYARSKVGKDVQDEIVNSDKIMFESLMNRVIKVIAEYNRMTGVLPVFSMYEKEEVDIDLATRDKMLYELGARFNKMHFVETYNLKEESFTIQGEDKYDRPVNQKEVTFQEIETPPVSLPRSSVIQTFNGKAIRVKDSEGAIVWEAKEFAEQSQDRIADIVEFDDKKMQDILEEMWKPIFDYIESCETLEEAKEGLAKLFPKIDTDKIEHILMSKIFAAKNYGAYKQIEGE